VSPPLAAPEVPDTPLSVFDIVKIGIGPSSSHTMGPWVAMRDFIRCLPPPGIDAVERITVTLMGSLAKTGRGHGTHTAVILGLMDEDYLTTDIGRVPARVEQVRGERRLLLGGRREIAFDPERDLFLEPLAPCPVHSNTLAVRAEFVGGGCAEATYYSVGGGFVQRDGATAPAHERVSLPHPVRRAADLLRWCGETGRPIHAVVRENERVWRTDAEIDAALDRLFATMVDAIEAGCHTDGVLPGGLRVTRRARSIHDRLMAGRRYDSRREWIRQLRQTPTDLATSTSWITAFALAVNEVNASYGRIVTAPTNGACGVIPAVLFHWWLFTPGADPEQVREFLLVAGEIGCIFKKNATISAAAGGCQAEIGVSSSMAAAALTAVRGGTPAQCLMAAEIAMEHHLGMTCDPVGGLVQVPCIERNSMGAMKAITASQLALFGNPAEAKVSLDEVISTMLDTAVDMHSRYKETADGGLALRIPVVLADC
jgi:L-serine dehydratase